MASTSVIAGFIDLATYDELEKYFYGGKDAITFFVKKTIKSTWFTTVPSILSSPITIPPVGGPLSATISRAGDYLLKAWMRVVTPAVTITSTQISSLFPGSSTTIYNIYWTPNLGHHIIQRAELAFNDLVTIKFDNHFLDFWSAFSVDPSKKPAYYNSIYNPIFLVQPETYTVIGTSITIPSAVLNVPLPFSHFMDTGHALPTAALPYNDMKINIYCRDPTELLLVMVNSGGAGPEILYDYPTSLGPVGNFNIQVWGEYSLVSNPERKKMGASARDIAIKQVQNVPYGNTAQSSYDVDLRYAHAVQSLFFAVRPITPTLTNLYSVYTIGNATPNALNPLVPQSPIQDITLYYENTQRLDCMPSDYFNFIEPYYKCLNINSLVPIVFYTTPSTSAFYNAYLASLSGAGLLVYNYTLFVRSLVGMGSTNYGKLTNVNAKINLSSNAVSLIASKNTSYITINQCVNLNVVRCSGGALGFPTL